MDKIEELEKHIAKLEKQTRKLEKQLITVMNALGNSTLAEDSVSDDKELDKIISDGERAEDNGE